MEFKEKKLFAYQSIRIFIVVVMCDIKVSFSRWAVKTHGLKGIKLRSLTANTS